MAIAYYNPEQEERIKGAKDDTVEKMYAASNRGMGFVRMRCADCTYYNQPDITPCPEGGHYCTSEDWFCAEFKPKEKYETDWERNVPSGPGFF